VFEQVADAVAGQVGGEGEDEDGSGRAEGDPRVAEQVGMPRAAMEPSSGAGGGDRGR
jgi:hypothetical protein